MNLATIIKAVRSILSGSCILICDEGQTCLTFIGSGIADNRVKSILLSNLK